MLIINRKKMQLLSAVILLILGTLAFNLVAVASDEKSNTGNPAISLIAYEIPIDEITDKNETETTETEAPRMGAETSDSGRIEAVPLWLMCSALSMVVLLLNYYGYIKPDKANELLQKRKRERVSRHGGES